ncbi:DUF998 domain-containing protein [Subtercola sp. RTI3]|uniref:DUF998 domain-containing protein n=1 Tax=Subtercola sp. RTI3 TaxID=3048639 RepID=UPI002B23E170|nr:DUF998 domain-containing protein [Subtercola sp. RTI3]MEA9985965.1 DUF998 domain-containing protein [Subtercola sp. RTI3]
MSLIQHVSAGVTVAAVISAAAALTTLELAPTGLSSLRAATSQYALTAYTWGFQWFEVSLAIAATALAISVASRFPRHRNGLVVSLVLVALGRSVVGWINMDAPGSPATARGDVHWTLGIISFIATVFAMFFAQRTFRDSRHDSLLSRWSALMGATTAAAIVLLFAASQLNGLSILFGLFERAYYISTMIWIATIAVNQYIAPAGRR